MSLCWKCLVPVWFSFIAVLANFAAGQEYCQTNHWQNGYHPHPTFCDRYVKCENLHTTIVMCGGGLLFDPVVSACISAASVTAHCNDAFTTPAPITTGENWCQQNHWADGLHPHPQSCDRFVQCHNQVTTITFCQSGTSYNIYNEICTPNAPPCNDAKTTPSTSVAPQCVNTTRGDIVFIFDSSSSITYADYQKQLSFAAEIARRFPLGPSNVQFSVVVFSIQAQSMFNFNSFYNIADLQKAIMNTTYIGSTTNTYLALDHAREKSFSAAQGARSGVPHIAVVMTDGFSSDMAETKNAAQRLKDSGVTTLAIGIGLFNRTELDSIASSPSDVWQVGSYNVLTELDRDLFARLCHSALNKNCTEIKMADIIFVLDSSNSVGYPNFEKLLRFAANLTQDFALGPNDVRFAVLVFSATVQKLFDLNTYNDYTHIYQAIMNALYMGSSTNTAAALRFIADNNMFSTAHGGRDGATKVIITITDGQSDRPEETRSQANIFKGLGYHMMSIGIGMSYNQQELVTLSTHMNNIFNVDNFDGLSNLQNQVYVQTCQIPSQVNFGELWNICREQNWVNGIHAHPFDCTKFIECTFLHTAVLQCPASLVYDPLKKTCMYKNDAISCSDYNDYNPFPGMATVAPTMVVVHDVSNVCRENHWPNGAHPHPYDCKFYLSCLNGVTTEVACRSGTVFDPTDSSCKDPAVAHPCNDAYHGSGQITTPHNFVPTTTDISSVCFDYNLPDGIYPDPGSCVHYVDCANGNTYHMRCPDGLEFNTHKNVCDDVHNINCNDNYNFAYIVHTG